MRKLWTTCLALWAAMLCVPALAAEEAVTSRQAEPPARLSLAGVWGTAAWEEGSLHLTNSDPGDPYNDVIVHLSEDTAVVDAVTGLPMDAAGIAGGDTVYAWVGPAMTLSVPPQAAAQVVIANVPEDAAAPQYYEMASVGYNASGAVPAMFPAKGTTEAKVTAVDGGTVVVSDDTEYLSHGEEWAYTWRDLVPGDRFLAWTDGEGGAYRVLRFPYAYRGYVDALHITGKDVQAPVVLPDMDSRYEVRGRVPYGMEEPYLALRPLAEALGLSVVWDAEEGAVVSENGEPLFSAIPGGGTVQTPGGERGLNGPVLIAEGVTYLSALDLAELLDLFWA